MSDLLFERYGAYYDLLYRDKDYAAEADYVVRTLREAEPSIQTVLEFGAGTGKHGRLLAQRGLDVTGMERSQAMAAAAEKASLPDAFSKGAFTCMVGDLRTTDLKRTFDAVIALFHVISYQTSNDDVLEGFRNAARHLRIGGIFLFDVWHGPAVVTEQPSVRVKRVEDENTALIRLAEPTLDAEKHTVDVHYTVFARAKRDGVLTSVEEHHLMRYFFPAEIDLLASESGFRVERAEEFLTGATPTDHTWGVAYLLRKIS